MDAPAMPRAETLVLMSVIELPPIAATLDAMSLIGKGNSDQARFAPAVLPTNRFPS